MLKGLLLILSLAVGGLGYLVHTQQPLQSETSLGATIQQVVQGGTGSTTLTGILLGNGTSGVRTLSVGTNLSLVGTTLSATGGGGGSSAYNIATTSGIGISQLAFFKQTSGTTTLDGVSTTSLTASSPLALSQPVVVIGSSPSALSLSTAGTWSGLAGTASALAADPTDCSAGSFPLGINAAGTAQNCTDAWTEAENTTAAYAAQATTLNVAGTAQQVTSSAGAQSLAANRTWTLSLPNYVKFPSSYSAALGSTTNATSTNLDVTGLFTFNGVTASTWAAFCTTITGGSGLCDGVDATAAGAADPFTWESNYGATNAATTSIIWAKNGLNASSTSHFVNASSSLLTSPTVFSDRVRPTASANSLFLTNDAFDNSIELGSNYSSYYSAQSLAFNSDGTMTWTAGSQDYKFTGTGVKGILDFTSVDTADKTFIYPNANGTLALGTGSAGNCAQWSTTNTLTAAAAPCGSGGGGSSAYNIATTSNIGISQLAFFKTTSGTTTLDGVATTSATISTGLAYSGTFGALVGGVAGNLTLATINAGVLGAVTNGAVPTSQATSTLYGAVQNGKTLGGSGGIIAWLATTTFSGGLTYSAGNVTADLGTSIVVGELASADFGDWTCNGSACTLDTTPAPATRALTIAGTSQQITSSAGSQDLSADRTWTLSLPNYVKFPSSYSADLGSTTNATSTNLTVTTLASTTALRISNIPAALVLTGSGGLAGAYGGASACAANNFVTTISSVGATTCGTASISGVALGSNLNAHTVSGSLSGTSYNGSAAVSDWAINLANSNSWTVLQNFTLASTTQLSALDALYIGRTSTTTIRGDNIASTIPFASTTAVTVSGTASTTNLIVSGLTSGRVPFVTTAGSITDSANLTFNGTTLTANTLNLSNVLTVGNGGTGTNSFTVGSVLFGNGSSAISQNNSNFFWSNTVAALGIGTTTPRFSLTLASSTAAQLALSGGAGVAQWAFRNAGGNLYIATTSVAGTATSTPAALTINNSGTGLFVGTTTNAAATGLAVQGTVYLAGLTTSASTQAGYLCLSTNNEVISDSTTCLISAAKFKKDIKDLDTGLEEFMQLRPVSYFLKNGTDINNSGQQIGFIADEALKVDSRLVVFDDQGEVHGFRYEQVTALITKAVQDLYGQFQKLVARVAGLEEKVDNQQKQIDDLEARLNALEHEQAH